MSKLNSVTAAVFTASMLAAAGSASAETMTFSDMQSAAKAAVEEPAAQEAAIAESRAQEVERAETTTIEAAPYEVSDMSSKNAPVKEPTKNTSPYANDSTYTFNALHGKDSAVVNPQLGMNVTASGKNAVAFTFFNNNPGDRSSITDIYFAGTDGMLLLPGKITDQTSGVSFSLGADPKDLPGGKPFDFSASVGADSNAPTSANGVNTAKEYVTWTFALASGASYDSVIKSLDSGKMRVGLLVPGMSGGSASFINTCGLGGCSQTPSVPLPASLWLMFSAMGGLAVASRRRKAARKA